MASAEVGGKGLHALPLLQQDEGVGVAQAHVEVVGDAAVLGLCCGRHFPRQAERLVPTVGLDGHGAVDDDHAGIVAPTRFG